ncbi:hypothetical protein [uncultured Methanofollis sp.]|uniref:hypothetical protein n=1 Tax=uncultured Methanofollis sp. TaxID=262500 RepID=UPI00262BBE63|nr:hypothetical protein [uncultured Methanofollis sp.]
MRNSLFFFGHVVSALESSFPDLDDESYNTFIDSICFKILDTPGRASDPEQVERVIESATRLKKGKNPRSGLEVIAGLKLMKSGDFEHAIPYLTRYRSQDLLVHTSLAFCYYALSLSEVARSRIIPRAPGEMELRAREQMAEVARIHRDADSKIPFKNSPWLVRTFWLMISCAIEWFPSERAFIKIGLEKAKRDGNREMKDQILKVAQNRFFQDREFLQEAFDSAIEEGDGGRAAGVVKQMIQQYPESAEPFYFGMLLSLRTTTRSGYHTFRKQAIEKRMPPYIASLLDIAFSALSGRGTESYVRIRDMKKKYPSMDYYLTPVNYLAHEISSEDEKQVKKAKKALIDSIDAYCRETLKAR